MIKDFKRSSINVLVGLLLLAPFLFLILNKIFPLPEPYEGKDFARVVLDSDGRPLRYFADRKGEWRYHVDITQVSPLYLEALIGYEDRYFYSHPGINPASLIRSAIQLIKNRKIISGGSTITMQVARIIDPHTRTLQGKLKQMFRALQLEYKYSKTEILEIYLNLAPFGGNIQGVQAASYAYFDRDVMDLTHSEAALMVALPQAPSRLRPDKNPVEATLAKNKVAERMGAFGIWDNATVTDVLSEPVITFMNDRPASAPLLAEKLVREYPDAPVINTYIQSDLQIFLEGLLFREKYRLPPGSSAAVIVVNNADNTVIGYAGSLEYGDNQSYGYIDMASAIRSPGSALKPFIYGMGIDKGLIHSQSLLIDAPRIFSTYQAGNFYQNFSGAVSMESALQRSLNVPAVQVLEHVTPEYFYSAILNTGVRFPLLGGKPNLSIALGGGGIRLTDLAALYTALANEGLASPLRFTSIDEVQQSRPLLSAESAYIIYDILRKQYRNDNLYFEDVTGRRNRLAWKTGTSYGFRDAIAVGVTKEHTVAVWVGKPDNTPSPGQYGAITASPILFTISDYLERNLSAKQEIERPQAVQDTRICWPSGLAENMNDKADCHAVYTALTVQGATPATLPETPLQTNQTYRVLWQENKNGLRVNQQCSPDDIRTKSAAIWPRLVEPWIAKKYRRSSIIPRWAPGCITDNILSDGEIIITSIVDKSTLRSGTVSDQYPYIALSAAGATGTVSWYLNGELIAILEAGVTRNHQITSAGTYQLVAIDSSLKTATVTFFVD